MFDTAEDYQNEIQLINIDLQAWKNALEQTKRKYIEKFGAEVWDTLKISIFVNDPDLINNQRGCFH